MATEPDDIETRAGLRAPHDDTVALAESPPRQPESLQGRRIDRYVVLQELGKGGMGEVYLAYDPELDRRVAIKLLRRDRDVGAEAQERLVREAQALAKLSHPNIVAVHDVGTILEGTPTVYVAMEYIEGGTLRAWAKGKSWHEIVAAYRAAAAGLAAAHRHGIVHRDFKPTNVIVGADGRVRVLDFGLARKVGETIAERDIDDSIDRSHDGSSAELSASRLRSSAHLTQTGFVVGTPAYMAPEQYGGAEVDGRADQFSFCVALYEALFGLRPFDGREAARIVKAVRAGRIREPKSYGGVPKRLRAAIGRGLLADPGARHRDMDALGAELDRALRPISRTGLLVALAAIGIVATQLWASSSGADDPCGRARDRLDGIWDDARRQATIAAFAQTAVPYADDASRAVVRDLDAWTDAWVDARTDACAATRVRGEQSEDLMDLRIACLDHRRADLAALVDVFANADADVVRNAIGSAWSLRSVTPCADPEYLRSAVRPPEDPAIAEQVEQLRTQLAEANARLVAGKYADATDRTEALLEAARTLGYDPLLAEAALRAGQALERSGRFDHARLTLDEAVFAAARCGHAAVEAESLANLVHVVGYRLADPTAAERHARHAEAIAERLGRPELLLAMIASHEANALTRAGRYDDAMARARQALATGPGVPAVRQLHLAIALNIGAILGAQGNYVEARAALVEAVARLREEYGPHHPQCASALMNLGITEWKLGDLDAALEHLQEAELVLTAAVGPTSAELAQILQNLGVVFKQKGDDAKAIDHYERALAIKRAALGEEHPSVALTLNNIGSIFYEQRRDDEAARALERAIEIYDRTVGRDHPDIGIPLATLGRVRLRAGDPRAAIELFERALERRAALAGSDATSSEARVGLARALLLTGGDRARARALAERARADHQADPTIEAAERAELTALLRDLDLEPE